jgi:hypothetical protein
MRVVPVPGVRDLRLSPTWVDCQLFPMTVVLHSRDLVRILGKLNITDIRSTVRQRVSAFARLSRNAHDAGLWIGVLPEERLHKRMFWALANYFRLHYSAPALSREIGGAFRRDTRGSPQPQPDPNTVVAVIRNAHTS